MHSSKRLSEVNTSSTFRVTTLVGQGVGAAALFLGFGFFLLGLSGTVDLILESPALSARFLNGSPGLVFALIGLFVLWRYKPKGSTTVTEEHIIETRQSGTPTPGQVPPASPAAPQSTQASSSATTPSSSQREADLRAVAMALATPGTLEDRMGQLSAAQQRLFIEVLLDSSKHTVETRRSTRTQDRSMLSSR